MNNTRSTRPTCRERRHWCWRVRLSVHSVTKLALPAFAQLILLMLAGPAAFARPSSPPDPVFYLIPFSHLDLFWGGTREEDLARG
jgi:hypothetical protein